MAGIIITITRNAATTGDIVACNTSKGIDAVEICASQLWNKPAPKSETNSMLMVIAKPIMKSNPPVTTLMASTKKPNNGPKN